MLTERGLTPRLRHAQPSDGPLVQAFVFPVLWAQRLKDPHPDLMRFGQPNNGSLMELVAVNEKNIPVGMTSLYPSRSADPLVGWIAKLFVDPLARGEGTGRRLLLAVLTGCRSFGFNRVALSTLPIFHEAIHLYESVGFVRVNSRRKDWMYQLILDRS